MEALVKSREKEKNFSKILEAWVASELVKIILDYCDYELKIYKVKRLEYINVFEKIGYDELLKEHTQHNINKYYAIGISNNMYLTGKLSEHIINWKFYVIENKEKIWINNNNDNENNKLYIKDYRILGNGNCFYRMMNLKLEGKTIYKYFISKTTGSMREVDFRNTRFERIVLIYAARNLVKDEGNIKCLVVFEKKGKKYYAVNAYILSNEEFEVIEEINSKVGIQMDYYIQDTKMNIIEKLIWNIGIYKQKYSREWKKAKLYTKLLIILIMGIIILKKNLKNIRKFWEYLLSSYYKKVLLSKLYFFIV